MSWVIAIVILVFLFLCSVAVAWLSQNYPKVFFTLLLSPMVLGLVFLLHKIVEKGMVQ